MSVVVAGLVGALLVVVGAASGAEDRRASGADLKVRALSNPPASVERGGPFTSALRVANLGRRTARRSTVRGYLSRDSRKSRGDIPLQPARAVPRLRPGKAARRGVIARVPRATSTGLWFLIACADAARIVRETNERNNCRTAARRTVVKAAGTPPSSPPPPPPGGEPAPIAGQGYTARFQDNFDGTALDASRWTDHEFWLTPEPGSVAVSGGTLKVINDRAGGYSDDVSVQSGPEWGGSASEPIKYDFMFGYVEARLRFTGGKGSWPAFWLQSSAHARHGGGCPEPDLNFEFDIMEFQGDEPDTFYGTIHRNTGSRCGVSDSTRPDLWPRLPNLANTWHTFAVLWTATEIRWYMDDQLIFSATPFDSADQRMFLTLTMQACGWDASNDCDASTPAELRTEVDWVRVWQK